MNSHRPGLLGTLGLGIGRLLIGRRFGAALAELDRAQWLPPAELKARSDARLAELLRRAAEHVPFYREVYRARGLAADALGRAKDLAALPVVDKAVYRGRPAADFLADDLGPHRRLAYTTSGSTGDPFPFFLDRQALPLVYASHLFYDSWWGIEPLDRGVRMMAPPAAEPPFPAGTPWMFRLRQRLNGRLQALHERLTQRRFNLFDVDAARIEEIHRVIDDFRPAFVMGYTSTVAMMADLLLRRGLPLARPPKAVITIAETLTPPRRRLIEEYFRAPIANRYGQREFKYWCAQSCRESPERFHVNTELVAWEVLRADGSPAEPGEVGRVVLTNLHNHVMPFIRYETGDLAALAAESCPCGRGFPVVTRLEGRSQEVLTTPSGRMISPVGLGQYLFVTLDWVQTLRHYQLEQTAADAAVLKVVPVNGLDDAMRERLRSDMARLLGDDVQVRVAVVDAIPLEKSGKRPVIKTVRRRIDGS